MKILVTGGLGFIGSCFIRRNQQHKILCIDKLNYAANKEAAEHPDLELIGRDVASLFLSTAGSWLLKGVDWIVHFAAESHVDNSINGPLGLVENNVLAALHVLEASRLFSIPCILVSTDEVFGEGIFTEQSPYHPNNPYSASKASGDLMADSYYHTFGAPVIVTHSCNNYGEWQHSEKFIPTILRSVFSRNPVPVYGNGQNVRDWIYVEDHCSAIEFLMEYGQFGQHYCVSASHSLTNLQLLDDMFRRLPEYTPKYKFVKDRPGHDKRYITDASKLRSLGWSPLHSFDRAIQRTIEFYKQAHGRTT